jgi:hypothetical protein
MESVLLGVIGESVFAVQEIQAELMTDALNAYMISAGIAICTSTIHFTHVQGAPSSWIGI